MVLRASGRGLEGLGRSADIETIIESPGHMGISEIGGTLLGRPVYKGILLFGGLY